MTKIAKGSGQHLAFSTESKPNNVCVRARVCVCAAALWLNILCELCRKRKAFISLLKGALLVLLAIRDDKCHNDQTFLKLKP